MCIVYVIYGEDFDRYYVGMTNNVAVRLKQHNSGKMKSTKAFAPWEMVHAEEYVTRVQTRRRKSI